MTIFTEAGKAILKFKWYLKGPQVVKTIFKKKNKVTDFKTYYKSTVIKSVVLA